MDTFKIELPKDIAPEIAEKIAKNVRNSYYFEASKAIADAVEKKLEDDDFVDRIATHIFDNLKVNEDDYTKIITEKIKDSLLNVTGVMANATLKAVAEKIKSYGFIKIASDRF